MTISLHLKLALRQMAKARFFTLINIFGLALGIAVSVIILITVLHETQFDRFNRNLDRIYRLEEGEWALMSPNIAHRIAERFPEIEKVTRFSFYEFRDADVRWNDSHVKLPNFFLSDSSLFDVFSFHLTQGVPRQALITPFSVVLTEKTARAIFGNHDPVGEIIRVNNRYDFSVTGVTKDEPFSSLPFDAVGSFSTLFSVTGRSDYPLNGYMNFQEYFLLAPGTDVDLLTRKINDYLMTLPEFEGSAKNFRLRPMKDIYFSNDIKYEIGSVHGNPMMLRILVMIAIFIFVLAVINFINLTTARSGLRARETAVRKVYGATRERIVIQFISESILISFLAFVMAMIIAEFSLPSFARLFEKQLDFSLLQSPYILPAALAVIVFTGIISGLYPAFYMSRYNTLKVLKGELNRGKQGIRIRRYLIISQFVIAAGLIFATQVIHQQVRFMRNKDLGFDKDHVICVSLSAKVGSSALVFREMLLSHPGITAVTFTNAFPGNIGWQESWLVDGENHQFTYLPVDENYIDFMGLELTAGRKFSADRPSEKDSMLILNETAVAEMGIKNPVGYTHSHMGSKTEIIGVVRDFHFNSLHAPIAPLALVWRPSSLSRAMIRVHPGSETQALNSIRDAWQQLDPQSLFTFTFLNDSFDQLYKDDMRFGRLFDWFTVISVLIAALGLFGMASFMTGSRKREIAIRKVNGASVSRVVRLYLSEFLVWVLLADIIALPLVTLGMDKWLRGFPYAVHPGLFLYIATLAGSLAIAGLTVLWHTLKAGYQNPADNLKYE